MGENVFIFCSSNSRLVSLHTCAEDTPRGRDRYPYDSLSLSLSLSV